MDVRTGPIDEHLHQVGDHVLPTDDEHEEERQRPRRHTPVLDEPDDDADDDHDQRAAELRDRAQHRGGEVGRVRPAPRREAAVEARESGVGADHPEQDADRERADDDDRDSQREQQPGCDVGIDARACERTRTAIRLQLVADDGSSRTR